jgi:hypothetical protein
VQPDPSELRALLEDGLRLFSALAIAPDPKVSGPARRLLLGLLEAGETLNETETADAAA